MIISVGHPVAASLLTHRLNDHVAGEESCATAQIATNHGATSRTYRPRYGAARSTQTASYLYTYECRCRTKWLCLNATYGPANDTQIRRDRIDRPRKERRIRWIRFRLGLTQSIWIGFRSRFLLYIPKRLQPTPEPNWITRGIPPNPRIVISEVVVILPGFSIPRLSRERVVHSERRRLNLRRRARHVLRVLIGF